MHVGIRSGGTGLSPVWGGIREGTCQDTGRAPRPSYARFSPVARLRPLLALMPSGLLNTKGSRDHCGCGCGWALSSASHKTVSPASVPINTLPFSTRSGRDAGLRMGEGRREAFPGNALEEASSRSWLKSGLRPLAVTLHVGHPVQRLPPPRSHKHAPRTPVHSKASTHTDLSAHTCAHTGKDTLARRRTCVWSPNALELCVYLGAGQVRSAARAPGLRAGETGRGINFLPSDGEAGSESPGQVATGREAACALRALLTGWLGLAVLAAGAARHWRSLLMVVSTLEPVLGDSVSSGFSSVHLWMVLAQWRAREKVPFPPGRDL